MQIGIVLASLENRCCHSDSGLAIPYLSKACCKARWQILAELTSAALLGGIFHTVAKPKQDLRITSVWPPIAANSANGRPCLTSDILVGTVLSRTRPLGKRAASGPGAMPWQLLAAVRACIVSAPRVPTRPRYGRSVSGPGRSDPPCSWTHGVSQVSLLPCS